MARASRAGYRRAHSVSKSTPSSRFSGWRSTPPGHAGLVYGKPRRRTRSTGDFTPQPPSRDLAHEERRVMEVGDGGVAADDVFGHLQRVAQGGGRLETEAADGAVVAADDD